MPPLAGCIKLLQKSYKLEHLADKYFREENNKLNYKTMDENKENRGDGRWYDEMLQILAEDIRETKVLVKETREMTLETRRVANEAEKTSKAAWELVVMTRNDLMRPWWKKLFNVQ